jgi:hypothetical protein
MNETINWPLNIPIYRDLEFLNMFSENLAALNELEIAVQEFTDSYVYIKGYNRPTVERIQHMYMKTYRVCTIDMRLVGKLTFFFFFFDRLYYKKTNYCKNHVVRLLSMINSWN